MSVSTSINSYSPVVESFVPLLYISWADGLLSPSERAIIKDALDQIDQIDPNDKALILEWSNPSNWPSEATFKKWLDIIKKAKAELASEKPLSLVSLAEQMAERRKVTEDDDQALSRSTLEALKALESKLDLEGMHRLYAQTSARQDRDRDKDRIVLRALQSFFNGSEHAFRKKVKVLLSDPIFNLKKIETKEVQRKQVTQWVQLLANQGYGALAYPRSVGGQDNIEQYAIVFETLAYFDLSTAVKFGVQFGLFGGAIHQLGTQKHHQKYLTDTAKMTLPGCFAMTETGHGSNVRELETTATYDQQNDQLIIHSPSFQAGKEYIGNALDGRMAAVFCQLIVNDQSEGIHAVLVPLRDKTHQLLPGIRVEDCGYKMGLNGVDNGRIWFDHVKVPRENLLDRFGSIDENGKYSSPIDSPARRFFTMLGTLVGGRICVGIAAQSAAKLGLSIATQYALKRRQFARAKGELENLLLDYPTHQQRLLPRIAKVYALNCAFENLMKMYLDRNENNIREIETLAAGLKAYSTDFCTSTLQECREACGGKGYLWENRIPDLKADADIFTTFEGDNTVLMQLVAKGCLSEFKDAFADDGIRGIIKGVYAKMESSMATLNPVYKRKTDHEHLQKPGFHLHAFRYRERAILFSLSGRLRNMLRKRISPYDAFLRCQTHMITLAEAFIERSVLEAYYSYIESLESDNEVKNMHLDLAQLYALSTMLTHKGWYLEKDYMAAIKTKAIRRQFERLCVKLKKSADVLVNGFDIPQGLVNAPIAMAYPS